MQSYGAFDLSKFAENKHRFYDLGTKRMADVAEELEAQMMATATLLNVGTPGPALAAATGTNTTLKSNATDSAGGVALTTAGTYYNLNSISLTAGTWAVFGEMTTGGTTGTITPALSGTTASGTNLAPVQTKAGGTAQGNTEYIGAVIKVASTTTVYLNGTASIAGSTGYGTIFAIQIA